MTFLNKRMMKWLMILLFFASTEVIQTYKSVSVRVLDVNQRLLRRKLNMDFNRQRERLFETYKWNEYSGMDILLKDHREIHGKRLCWWGDFDAKETRGLYHKLIRDTRVIDTSGMTETELYNTACESISNRIVAKLYSRERATIPVLLFSITFDIVRNRREIDSETIWKRYTGEMSDHLDKTQDKKPSADVCRHVILKSYSTNYFIDSLLPGVVLLK